MPRTIGRKDLLALRLASQGVFPPVLGELSPGTPAPGPASVVHRMLAMQAQDFGQATWTIGSRVPGSILADVLGALDRGEIVRSWPMRGTLHVVVPRDLRWMLRLTTPRLHQGLSTRFRQLDLDPATFARAEAVAYEALSGGRALPRDGFLRALEESGIRTSGQRGPHLIGWLAQRAVVCWGPSAGRQQALVLLDEWAPEHRVLDRDESLREFALRYFTGHGPASVRDLAWWTKLTLADARRGTALASDDLVEVDFEGTPHYLGMEADARTPARSSVLRLLGGFDEFVLGYQDRSVAVPEQYLGHIVPGDNGVFLPTIVSGRSCRRHLATQGRFVVRGRDRGALRGAHRAPGRILRTRGPALRLVPRAPRGGRGADRMIGAGASRGAGGAGGAGGGRAGAGIQALFRRACNP